MKNAFLPILIILIASILRLWMLNAPDFTEDERHYVVDSQRLFNKDQYIASRYHTQNHPTPSIGHPFLYQIEQEWIFKLFGISTYTSRLPNALSGIGIVILILLFTKQLGGKISVLAALLMAILPIAVRYSRNAQLDTLFTFWITLTALCIWRYINGRSRLWLLLAGTAAGLTISTKLNGIYIVPMFFLVLFFTDYIKGSLIIQVKKIFPDLIFVTVPCLIVSFLLNDPSAYIDGILNPSFEAYSFFSKQFIVERLPIIFSIGSFLNFVKANVLLLSPVFFLVFWISLIRLIFKERGRVKRFLILWILPLLNIFIIHGFDADGIYGWIPFLPPTLLGVSYMVNNMHYKQIKLIVISSVLVILPFVYLYGLQNSPLPFKGLPLTHNRTINETFYQDIVNEVNNITPKNGRLLFLPQSNYPLFALRSDISWSYILDENFDVYVVSSPSTVEAFRENLKLVEIRSAYQDGENLTRLIYSKR